MEELKEEFAMLFFLINELKNKRIKSIQRHQSAIITIVMLTKSDLVVSKKGSFQLKFQNEATSRHYAFQMESLLNFLRYVDGRSKVFMFIQYFCKYLMEDQVDGNRLKNLETALSDARKVLLFVTSFYLLDMISFFNLLCFILFLFYLSLFYFFLSGTSIFQIYGRNTSNEKRCK
jgi:hypothetical protein